MPVDTTLFIDTVTIERPDREYVGVGKVPVNSQVATGVRCRVEQLSGGVDPSILGRFPDVSHRVYFNLPADVQVHDKLTDQNGTEYVVNNVNSLYGDHAEVLATEKP